MLINKGGKYIAQLNTQSVLLGKKEYFLMDKKEYNRVLELLEDL